MQKILSTDYCGISSSAISPKSYDVNNLWNDIIALSKLWICKNQLVVFQKIPIEIFKMLWFSYT